MKIVLFILLSLVYIETKEVQACEIPIAGISPTLTAYEDYRANRNDKGMDAYIEDYSLLYGVDSDLVKAVIICESDGQADAVNHNDNGTHDRGLMQINSFNFDWLTEELGITDFYDPEQNIKAGSFILGLLVDKYDDYHRVLMCYNMGEKRTRELWNRGVRSSEYSRKVMKKFEELKEGQHE